MTLKTVIKNSLLVIMFLVTEVFAINNVAVLELVPNESVTDEIRIEESRHLTDELRRQAVMTLPKGEYSILTRDNLISLMPPDEEQAACLAESCAVDIGRAIGAEYITQGAIGKFGSKMTISVELYETLSGKLLSSIVFESENIDGLLNVIRKEASSLFQSIPTQKHKIRMRLPQWLGIGLAAAGLGMGVYGILQNSEYKDLNRDYLNAADNFDKKWKDVKDAKSRRDLGYIIGSALLASGITIYFVF
jgi:TolB-like protein